MIIDVRSKTKAQFRNKFEEMIKESSKHDMTILGFSALGSFVGEIDGDHFTVVRTAGLFSNMPQRHFYGDLFDDNDGIVVKGDFRFSKVFYQLLAGAAIVIFLFLLLTCEGGITVGGVLKGILISAAIPAVPYLACLLTSLFFEKETIRALEEL